MTNVIIEECVIVTTEGEGACCILLSSALATLQNSPQKDIPCLP